MLIDFDIICTYTYICICIDFMCYKTIIYLDLSEIVMVSFKIIVFFFGREIFYPFVHVCTCPSFVIFYEIPSAKFTFSFSICNFHVLVLWLMIVCMYAVLGFSFHVMFSVVSWFRFIKRILRENHNSASLCVNIHIYLYL